MGAPRRLLSPSHRLNLRGFILLLLLYKISHQHLQILDQNFLIDSISRFALLLNQLQFRQLSAHGCFIFINILGSVLKTRESQLRINGVSKICKLIFQLMKIISHVVIHLAYLLIMILPHFILLLHLIFSIHQILHLPLQLLISILKVLNLISFILR